MNQSVQEYLETICEERPYKLVISNPRSKENEIRKIVICLQEHKNGYRYQIEKFTAKQAFHINIEETDLKNALTAYFGADYLQLSAWTASFEYQAKISSKGKLLTNRHTNMNRVEIQKEITGKNNIVYREVRLFLRWLIWEYLQKRAKLFGQCMISIVRLIGTLSLLRMQ